MTRVIRPEPLRAAVLEGRIRPLSRSLALRMLEVCAVRGPWRVEAVVVPDPPETLAEMLDRWTAGPFPVSGDHSDRTIWGHPDLNALFRAWHDRLHVAYCHDVDPEGEMSVAFRHLRLIDGAAERAILWAETWGQADFQLQHGRFPEDQRRFVVRAVRDGLDAAVRAGEVLP